MHRVDRGAEPRRLRRIRERYTDRWVRFYRDGQGARPTDSRWREFQPELAAPFSSVCGYCEESCKGDVDHFRPKSRNPELVYEWTNWVFACPTCNSAKREKWPPHGYVDPCSRSRAAWPEDYFEFDTATAEVLPRKGLTAVRRRKALQTIDDLKLNAYHHRKKRNQWLKAVSIALGSLKPHDGERDSFIGYVTNRERELSSISRHFLLENGYRLPDDA